MTYRASAMIEQVYTMAFLLAVIMGLWIGFRCYRKAVGATFSSTDTGAHYVDLQDLLSLREFH